MDISNDRQSLVVELPAFSQAGITLGVHQRNIADTQEVPQMGCYRGLFQ